MKESTKKTLAVMNAEHRYIDANCKTLKEFRIAINQLVDDDNMPEVLALIDKDRERAVLEGKINLISWSLSRTSMSELKQRWKELEDELAELSNPTQEKEGEVKLQPISLEDAIKAMGYLFRDLSYHSDGRWIARSGANTGRFMTSARTPRQAVFKLAEKIEQERRAKEKEKEGK